MKQVITIILIIAVACICSGCNRDKHDTAPDASNKNGTSTQATAQKDEVVPAKNLIRIENDKFNPQNLTLKKGETVTWVNNDTAGHWIVSDPYPTHSDLPELDSKKGLLQSETYQFTFNKVGQFNYYDHLNNTMTGTITVEK